MAGGYGTRIYVIQPSNVSASQILQGTGYVTIGLQGVHYYTGGNLWQSIFGGSDKVALSSHVTHFAGTTATSAASIEDYRTVAVGQSVYFGITGRSISLNLPTDCEAIEVDISMTAVKDDNLSGALDILGGDELKSTLQLAPAAVQAGVAIAKIVKSLLTSASPQDILVAEYAGRVTTEASPDPVEQLCLVQGTLVLLYRESDTDTSLDGLDPKKFLVQDDGLLYDGSALENTYVLLNVAFQERRGENYQSDWSVVFAGAEASLSDLLTAASDSDRVKIWAAAIAAYRQGVKLLSLDQTYTHNEAAGLCALHLKSLQDSYRNYTGHSPPGAGALGGLIPFAHGKDDLKLKSSDIERLATQYIESLSRSNLSLPGSALAAVKNRGNQ